MNKIFILLLCIILVGLSPDNKKPKQEIGIKNPSKEFLLGKTKASQNTIFTLVPTKYLLYKRNIYLEKNTFTAYEKMYSSALKSGIRLPLLSGFRSFWYQKMIWEKKWNGKRKVEGLDLRTIKDPIKRAQKILKYSSMPGTSRHHWGTDIDIYSLENANFETTKGKEVYKWLQNNAFKYGFCQTYTAKDSLRPMGYEEEKWHWTFFPISEKLLKEYQNKINYSDISGFDGSSTAKELKVIETYVYSINQECKKQ